MPGEQASGSVFDRDELGWLTSTVAFSVNATGRGASARAVAAEIIQCREGKGDYGSLPFGGPFKSWAQFHAFCDYLARGMVLNDDRFAEEHRRRQGTQALADVLKANFNPNYTPNEINPDRTPVPDGRQDRPHRQLDRVLLPPGRPLRDQLPSGASSTPTRCQARLARSRGRRDGGR
jgi:hypothetical protein